MVHSGELLRGHVFTQWLAWFAVHTKSRNISKHVFNAEYSWRHKPIKYIYFPDNHALLTYLLHGLILAFRLTNVRITSIYYGIGWSNQLVYRPLHAGEDAQVVLIVSHFHPPTPYYFSQLRPLCCACVIRAGTQIGVHLSYQNDPSCHSHSDPQYWTACFEIKRLYGRLIWFNIVSLFD